MEGLPEAAALPALGSALAGGVAGLILHRYSGREGRSWAVPLGVFIFFAGLEKFYDVPNWVMAAGFLITTTMLNLFVKMTQQEAASKHGIIDVPESGIRLRRVPDYTGRHVGVWIWNPAEKPPLPGSPAKPSVPPLAAAPEAPVSPVTITLTVEGLGQDDYRVVLRGAAARSRPGELAVFDAESPEPGVLAPSDGIEGMPGQPATMRVRAVPLDFAFQLLDMASFAHLQELLCLRSARRELLITVRGPRLELVSSSLFSEEEIPRLVRAAAAVLKRIDELGGLPK